MTTKNSTNQSKPEETETTKIIGNYLLGFPWFYQKIY